jgi:sugar phosphate isomerase/epimerase
MNRRAWLRLAGAATSMAGLGSAAAAFNHPLGLQLYTVRDVIQGREDEILRRVAEAGYTEVETAGGSMETLGPILRKYKLKAVSSHLNALAISANPPAVYTGPPLDRLMAASKADGFEYLVFPHVPPDQRGGPEVYQRLAETLNRADEQARAAGLTFCYHNHAFEFGGAPGRRPIDVLKAHLDQRVQFELDVFWISVAGNDPVAVVREFAGRVPLIHLKDKAAGTPVRFEESVPQGAFREVGSGVLDFPAILRAAAVAGVKHYFVEQDYSAGDPIESIRKSYQFLRAVKI